MINDYSVPEYRDADDYDYDCGQESHANDVLEEWRQCLAEQYELQNLLQCGFINDED